MGIKSKALEVNLADYHVDVDVDNTYYFLRDIMSVYCGVTEEFTTFLKELSHPYKNRSFIVKKTRRFSLEYFYLLKKHPEGEHGVAIYTDVLLEAVNASDDTAVQADAVDTLLVYLHKVITEAGTETVRFAPVINEAFSRILQLDSTLFLLFVRSYFPITRIAEAVLNTDDNGFQEFSVLNRLLLKCKSVSYNYWLKKTDPVIWFNEQVGNVLDRETLEEIFSAISCGTIKQFNESILLAENRSVTGSRNLTEQLVKLPGFSEIVKEYQKIPRRLFQAGVDHGMSNRWKLLFLFHIMSINGLSIIHEDTLRDINRTMKQSITSEETEELRELVSKTFAILKERVGRYPDTALNCVLSMGEGIYRTDNIEFVNYFIDLVIDLGFQSPMIEGVGDNWQIKANKDHIQNIRTWMKLIELKPEWSSRLLSALVIHLTISGIFIRDTDLFPRDITRFLGSSIAPVYNLCKQLARLFPVYFNEIGAEGLLRDISTEIDEICQRKDLLIHYLRKQSHVESSNRVISLMEGVLDYWRTGDKNTIKDWIPDDVFRQISPEGVYYDGVHQVIISADRVCHEQGKRLLTLPASELESLIDAVEDGTDTDRKRVVLAVVFCKLLYQKYRLDAQDLDGYILGLKSRGFPGITKLRKILAVTDMKTRLFRLIDYLDKLKKLILSDADYDVHEDIYQKRHITVDIPSMYGSYHETRFNAMGLMFRIESIVNVHLEEYVDTIDLSLITKATFFQIYNRLMIFDNALKTDGINSKEFEKQLNLMIFALGSIDFTYTQYLDIIKGFSRAVKDIINAYFHNIYKLNLDRILKTVPDSSILPKYLPVGEDGEHDKLRYRISEMFFREKIAFSLGLQQLDVFLSRILQTLYNQADILPQDKLQRLLNYDPKRAMAAIDKDETQAFGIVVLGNKGMNLCKLKRLMWPVPEGFIITTEVFRCRNVISTYPEANSNFMAQLAEHVAELERKTGKGFGDEKKPLLLSVRSGASISQPGMMDTLLNVGMNVRIAEQMAITTENSWFAWDSYRRFLQCYGMACDLERDDFDLIINNYKYEKGIKYKRNLTGSQMKELAFHYRDFILASGVSVVDDPMEQLMVCIRNVFNSWELPKAKAYRKIMGISDDWGTAVTVQSMVFGNLSRDSGSGVLFTHNPRLPGDTMMLWGDFTIGNQGEDVAAGLVNTLPISAVQIREEQHETDLSLESCFPDIFQALKEFAIELTSTMGWPPQEIEFTFESPSAGDLHILQTRDMVLDIRQTKYIFDEDTETFRKRYVAHGIGAGGSAMSGRIVFSLDDIKEWREKEPETSLILVRSDTVPDDIREIYAADGLLTGRGGMTSHASVVAHRLEKTCVVGCRAFTCNERSKLCMIRDLQLTSGDFISIDGHEGSIYQGVLNVRESSDEML